MAPEYVTIRLSLTGAQHLDAHVTDHVLSKAIRKGLNRYERKRIAAVHIPFADRYGAPADAS